MSNAIVGKKCSKCKVHKLRDDFQREPRRPDGLRCYCKQCGSRESRAYYAKTKNDPRTKERRVLRARRTALKRRFGITQSQYDALLDAQGGRCAICQSDTPGGRWPTFHVDHDHITGKVRGILCKKCNVALGMFGDTLAGVQRAVDYLSAVQSTSCPAIEPLEAQ